MNKWLRLTVIAGGALLLDAGSKTAIRRSFALNEQHELIGSYVRLTYIHNPGAAFGISLGSYSSVIFAALSIVALVALFSMYATTPAHDRVRFHGIALIMGGALGNLFNRLVVRAGVVDWIDVGIGTLRWPIFNFADIAVTAGAIILAMSLWQEEDAGNDVVNTSGNERWMG